MLMRGNTGSGVWVDSAYRLEEVEGKLRDRKLKSLIHHRTGKRGKPLTEQAKDSNWTKSTVRVRVEHIFGAQTNDMAGTLVRTLGLVRAKAKIGIKNLAYNMRRLVQLRRINPRPALKPGKSRSRSGRNAGKTASERHRVVIVSGHQATNRLPPSRFTPNALLRVHENDKNRGAH